MGVPKNSIRVMYVVQEGYSNQAMNHLVKQAKTGVSPSLLQSSPSKLFTISVTLDCLSKLLAVQRAVFAGLVQFGIFAPSCADPRQQKHIF